MVSRHQEWGVDGHGGQVCLAAPSGQVPKPQSGAPQARDLTAKGRAELSSSLP